MKMYEFQLKFHWSLFLGPNLQYSSKIGSDNGLTPTRRQAIIWTNFSDVYMHHSMLFWNIYSGHDAGKVKCSFSMDISHALFPNSDPGCFITRPYNTSRLISRKAMVQNNKMGKRMIRWFSCWETGIRTTRSKPRRSPSPVTQVIELRLFSIKSSIYRQISNIKRTFVGNKFVAYWYVVGT